MSGLFLFASSIFFTNFERNCQLVEELFSSKSEENEHLNAQGHRNGKGRGQEQGQGQGQPDQKEDSFIELLKSLSITEVGNALFFASKIGEENGTDELPSDLRTENNEMPDIPIYGTTKYEVKNHKEFRLAGVCPFCTVKINPVKCKCYAKIKSAVTKTSYFSNELMANDLTGFCSAAVFLYSPLKDGSIDFILIKETRNDVIGFNMPGGKRESVYDDEDDDIRYETSFETAVREFNEEIDDEYTLKSFQNSRFEQVYWSPVSKASVYIYSTLILCKPNSSKVHLFNSKTFNMNDVHEFLKSDLDKIFSYLISEQK